MPHRKAPPKLSLSQDDGPAVSASSSETASKSSTSGKNWTDIELIRLIDAYLAAQMEQQGNRLSFHLLIVERESQNVIYDRMATKYAESAPSDSQGTITERTMVGIEQCWTSMTRSYRPISKDWTGVTGHTPWFKTLIHEQKAWLKKKVLYSLRSC
jgi:hypothetical protein